MIGIDSSTRWDVNRLRIGGSQSRAPYGPIPSGRTGAPGQLRAFSPTLCAYKAKPRLQFAVGMRVIKLRSTARIGRTE
jgi:hypothetical protein